MRPRDRGAAHGVVSPAQRAELAGRVLEIVERRIAEAPLGSPEGSPWVAVIPTRWAQSGDLIAARWTVKLTDARSGRAQLETEAMSQARLDPDGRVGEVQVVVDRFHLIRQLAGSPLSAVTAILRDVVTRASDKHLDALARDARLTPRERQVALLAADGLDNAAISRELGIAVETTRRHIKSVFRKLGVWSRTELTALVCTGERSFPIRRDG